MSFHSKYYCVPLWRESFIYCVFFACLYTKYCYVFHRLVILLFNRARPLLIYLLLGSALSCHSHGDYSGDDTARDTLAIFVCKYCVF